MARISPTVELVWRIAADEALRSNATFIQPDHLLLGLCSVEKLFSSDMAHRLNLSPYMLAAVRAEWQDLLMLLIEANARPGTLREAIRGNAAWKKGTLEMVRKMSRSKESKKIFARAADWAGHSTWSEIGLVHLLAAMIEVDNPLTDLMQKNGVQLKALRALVASEAAKKSRTGPDQDDHMAQISTPTVPDEIKAKARSSAKSSAQKLKA